jgi:NitT/TauT family transport system substrate-binding protein
MFAITNGKKIYLIAEIQTSTQDEGIVARRDLGIIKPSDLKGKKIGVTLGTAADFFMDSFFLMHGINRQEVKIIDVNPEEMLEALRHGRVDAVSIWNPLLKQLQKELGDKGVVFLEEDISTTLFCFVVTYEFAKQNPKVIKKVLKALIKAEEFVMQHPEEAKKVIAEATQTEPAIIDDIWDGLTFKVTLDQSLLTSLEDQTRWAQKYGLTKGIEIHNYLDFIYFDGLQAVRPETVRIIR